MTIGSLTLGSLSITGNHLACCCCGAKDPIEVGSGNSGSKQSPRPRQRSSKPNPFLRLNQPVPQNDADRVIDALTAEIDQSTLDEGFNDAVEQELAAQFSRIEQAARNAISQKSTNLTRLELPGAIAFDEEVEEALMAFMLLESFDDDCC